MYYVPSTHAKTHTRQGNTSTIALYFIIIADVVEWSRALDIRLGVWPCRVSIVPV